MPALRWFFFLKDKRMYTVSQEKFEELINWALDTLPKRYIERLHNVAIVTADIPSEEQRRRLHLHNGQTLFGLYEGIPLTQRGSNYTMVLPDVITIFKIPIEMSVYTHEQLKEQIRHTLWHEIAHYFGLAHDAIYRLDGTKSEK